MCLCIGLRGRGARRGSRTLNLPSLSRTPLPVGLDGLGADEWSRTTNRLALDQTALPSWRTSARWYPRWDSNPHCSDPKSDVSCRWTTRAWRRVEESNPWLLHHLRVQAGLPTSSGTLQDGGRDGSPTRRPDFSSRSASNGVASAMAALPKAEVEGVEPPDHYSRPASNGVGSPHAQYLLKNESVLPLDTTPSPRGRYRDSNPDFSHAESSGPDPHPVKGQPLSRRCQSLSGLLSMMEPNAGVEPAFQVYRTCVLPLN